MLGNTYISETISGATVGSTDTANALHEPEAALACGDGDGWGYKISC